MCAVEAFSAEAPEASQGSVEAIHHALGSTQDGTGSQSALGEQVRHFLLYHILGPLAVPTTVSSQMGNSKRKKPTCVHLLHLQKKMVLLISSFSERNYFKVTKNFNFTLSPNTQLMLNEL